MGDGTKPCYLPFRHRPESAKSVNKIKGLETSFAVEPGNLDHTGFILMKDIFKYTYGKGVSWRLSSGRARRVKLILVGLLFVPAIITFGFRALRCARKAEDLQIDKLIAKRVSEQLTTPESLINLKVEEIVKQRVDSAVNDAETEIGDRYNKSIGTIAQEKLDSAIEDFKKRLQESVDGLIGSQLQELARRRGDATITYDMQESLRESIFLRSLVFQRAWVDRELRSLFEVISYSPSAKQTALNLRSFVWRYQWRLTHFAQGPITPINKPTTALAVSNQGDMLALCGEDLLVRLIKIPGANPILFDEAQNRERHEARINTAAFSLDGKWLATGGDDKAIIIQNTFNAQSTKLPHAHDASVKSLIFTPDGKLLVSCGIDKTVRFWDPASAKEVPPAITLPVPPLTLGIATNGSVLLFVGGEDGLIHQYALPERNRLADITGHKNAVRCLACAPDNATLISGSADGTAKLWDIATGKEKSTIQGVGGEVFAVAALSKGSLFVIAQPSGLTIWDMGESRPVTAHLAEGSEFRALSVPPGGDWLATSALNKNVQFWLFDRQPRRFTVDAVTPKISETRFALNAHLLVVQGKEQLNLYDIVKREPITRSMYDSEGSSAVAASGLKRMVLYARGDKGQISVIPIPEGSGTLLTSGLKTHIAALALSPQDGQWAYALSSGEVKVRPISMKDLSKSSNETASYKFREAPTLLEFSPNGRILAVGVHGKWLRLWSHSENGEPKYLDGSRALCAGFAPDSKLIATGASDGIVSIWDGNSGVHLFDLKGHSGPVRSVAFGDDGQTLASGGDDKAVRIWDVLGRRLWAILEGHTSPVLAVAFADEDRVLAALGDDHTVLTWQAARKDEAPVP